MKSACLSAPRGCGAVQSGSVRASAVCATNYEFTVVQRLLCVVSFDSDSDSDSELDSDSSSSSSSDA